jgi:hypothetical protein
VNVKLKLSVVYEDYESDCGVLIFQGGGSTAQKYLDKFMKALESYFHPANFGYWLLKLKDLLQKLPYYFIQRLHRLVEHKFLSTMDISTFVGWLFTKLFLLFSLFP